VVEQGYENGVVGAPTGPSGSTGVLIDLDKPRRISLNLWTVYQAEREWERRQGLKQGAESFLRPLLLDPYASIPITKLILWVLYGLKHFDDLVTFEEVAAWFDYRLLDEVIAKEGQAAQVSASLVPAISEALPFQEGITLTLNKPYRYRLNFAAEYFAAREYEQLLELLPESTQIADLIADYLHATHLLVLIRNGLRTPLAPPPLTLEQVGRAIPFLQIFPVVRLVNDAWIAAHPPQAVEQPPTEETRPASPPDLTGAPSGDALASTSG
jgi:hypothetical protein